MWELNLREKDEERKRGWEFPAEKMIKCIQVAWSEGRISARKPYLTAAYHSQLLPPNGNNEERFGSEQLVTVMLLPGLPLVDLERRSHLELQNQTHRSAKREHYMTNQSRLWQQGWEPGWGSAAGCSASLKAFSDVLHTQLSVEL